MADEKPVIDRTSMLTLDKEHLVRLLELAVKGQQATAANMLQMTELMKKADATLRQMKGRIAELETENQTLRSSLGCK
jgi:cell shape-determining protein MreC